MSYHHVNISRLIAVAGIALALMGAISSIGAFFSKYFISSSHPTTIEERVETFSTSLKDATALIAQIQEEINDRMEVVSNLEVKARTAQEIYNLNKEQVEAIATVFQGEMKKSERWDFWINVAQNMIFMVLGAFLGHFVERWMNKRRAVANVGQ